MNESQTHRTEAAPTRITIIGGGVAGVSAALALARRRLPNTHIRLINPSPYFEYHGALYRLVAGSSPLEVCIPLRNIFAGTSVEIVADRITSIDTQACEAAGVSGSTYRYDYAVLAVGAETDYFGIEGLETFAHTARSVSQALALKEHIAERIATACQSTDDAEKLRAGHMVVVGAGATGTELAGELSLYTRDLCQQHGVAPSYVTIELVETAPQVMPKLPDAASRRIERRLRDLQVNILTNRRVVSAENGRVCLRGMEIETDTVIWCAGVRANQLYARIGAFETNAKGAVSVDTHLRARGRTDIFIPGDGAATPHAGWAQTALRDGRFVADAVAASIRGRRLPVYRPRSPYSVVPVGPGWAAAILGRFHLYGRVGWWIRRLADFRVYLAVLPFRKACAAFWSGHAQQRAYQGDRV